MITLMRDWASLNVTGLALRVAWVEIRQLRRKAVRR